MFKNAAKKVEKVEVTPEVSSVAPAAAGLV
jgi:hypothetical protein